MSRRTRTCVRPILLLGASLLIPVVARAADLLMFPDLPPGILYPSGAGDPHPAQIIPITGNPAGAFAGSDYYLVQTGTVLNPGSAYGGIYFDLPSTYLMIPTPQRYKLQYAIRGSTIVPFQIHVNNQDGFGELNRLSHVATVTSSWSHMTHYATLDGQPFGGHANIPRRFLFMNSNNLWGGPGARFLVDAIELMPVMTGDFDEDKDHDCSDVDSLVAALVMGSTDSRFDLTDDGTVNDADLVAWRSAAGEALFGPGRTVQPGDANLDGVVDGSDFNVWNAHKFRSIAAWCSGDFTADGSVDGSDFNVWNAHKFTSSDASGLVPEPAMLPYCLVAAICLLARGNRQASNMLATLALICGCPGIPTTSMALDFTWRATPVSNNWESALNWSGGLPGQIPDDSSHTVLISGVPTNGLDPTLTVNRTIGALTIRNNGDFYTGDGTTNRTLTVQNSGGHLGTILIEGAGSNMYLYDAQQIIDVNTVNFTIGGAGQLRMFDNAVVQVSGQMIVQPGGFLSGSGTVRITGSMNAINDGTLRASGGQLRVMATGTARIDFDGLGENGALVAANDSSLVLDIPFVGPIFDGTMTIGRDASIVMNQPWTLNDTSGTQIDFNGGTGIATLGGAGPVTIQGRVNINSGSASWASPTTVEGPGYVVLEENTSLRFNAPTTILVPDRILNGVGSGGTTFIVNDTVNIGTGSGYFDWDNSGGGDGFTIVNPTGFLNIDVAHIDLFGEDEDYNGTILIHSGEVRVRSDGAWKMSGHLQMNNVAAKTPALSGDQIVVAGSVGVGGSGESRISADTAFLSGSSISVGASASLNLRGAESLVVGANWSGAGVVDLDNALTLFHNTVTVNMPLGTFDLDGNSSAVNQVAFYGPTTFNVQSIDNEGNSIGDWLAVAPNGRLTVNLTDPSAYWIMARELHLNAPAGPQPTLQLAGSDIYLSGATEVTGLSMSDARLWMLGPIHFVGNSKLVLRGGTSAKPNLVEPGATFTGAGGYLVVGDGSGNGYLRLQNLAQVATTLVNTGHLEVGTTTGSAHVAILNQTPTGIYHANIEGVLSGQYDVLNVDLVADLKGVLNVAVNQYGGSYADPMIAGTFDRFHLIQTGLLGMESGSRFEEFVYAGQLMQLYAGGVLDRFYVADGLFRILNYQYGSAGLVELVNYRALPGDANGDGVVDGSDFGIWNANKFNCGTNWTTGDFNGDGCTDGSDFGIWNVHKFRSVNLGRDARTAMALTNAVPVPETFTMVWLLIASLVARVRGTCGT